jgi:hypothetical protein
VKSIYALFGLALVASFALPASAQSPSPATVPTKPLRHLTFSLSVGTTYSSELRGVKDIANNEGATGMTTQNHDRADGTVVFDIIAARDEGDLLVDVSETLRGQSTPVSRIVLHADGQFNYLPNQKSLAPEAGLLVPFLARTFIGPPPHTAGETWTVNDTLDNFKATTIFKVTAVRAPADISVEYEESYTVSGAQSSNGLIRGRANYDPTKVVPRDGSFDTRSRSQHGDQYRVVTTFLEFTLKEDSFTKR